MKTAFVSLCRPSARLWTALASIVASTTVACAVRAQTTSGRADTTARRLENAVTDVGTLADRRPAVVSESLVMSTVRQYAKRPDLDGYLAGRSAEAKTWERKVSEGEARRVRVRNPYDPATYDKYYDDRGDWQFSVIENDYKAAQKLRADWSSAYTRARATVDDLRRECEALGGAGTLPASTRAELAGMLSTASVRLDQFGEPPPELLPRPVAGADNSPFPTYKAFDSYTGKVIEMGRRGSGGRPTAPTGVADDGRASSTTEPKASQAGVGGRVDDLSGAWNTRRVATNNDGTTNTYTGTLQLRRTGNGYEGEWIQAFTNTYGGRGRVVQAVTVTVTGNDVTVQGANPRLENAEGRYDADTMYLRIESPNSMSGRDVDTAKQKGTSRVWRP